MRNYKKESQWQNQKYELVKAYIDKELGQNLKTKLKKDGKSIASWMTENAERELRG